MGNGNRDFNYNDYDAVNINTRIRNSNDSVKASQIDMDINSFLESVLKNYNSRDVEAIRKHLDEIENVLSNNINELEKILYGGSVSKNTYIEGLSDIDALVILDSDIEGLISPSDLQDIFYKLLVNRFPKSEIKKGALAVTIKFDDYEVQLLPALKKNDKLIIAASNKDGWSNPINSKLFTNALTSINKSNNNKVIPVIKLTKSLLNNLPEKFQLSGYHIESLAVEAFKNYSGKVTLYDMTKHLLTTIETRVLTPMIDKTGQSGIIDSYLGAYRSNIRQQTSRHIKSINGRFSNSSSVDIFKTFFD
ncbi:MAG: nucleotidyltransferase [Eubacteriaceae bacterium]|nr:nucleotidyltransferase [Eubacteriaceae bacterium]